MKWNGCSTQDQPASAAGPTRLSGRDGMVQSTWPNYFPPEVLPVFLLMLRAFPRQPVNDHRHHSTPLHRQHSQAIDPNSARQRRLTKDTMGFWDTIADLAESVAPWSVAEAEAPAAEDSKVRQ